MRHAVRVLSAVLIVAAFVPGVHGAGEQEMKVMATIRGTAVTSDQVESQVQDELRKLEERRQQLLSQSLEQIIEGELIELEAASRGITAEELVKVEIEAKAGEPTTEEIDAYYEKNKARIKQPKEQTTDMIKQVIVRDKRVALQQSLIDTLQAKYEVRNFWEEKMAEARLARAKEVRAIVEESGHPSKGKAGAPVTLVVFSDFQCPYCSRVVPTVHEIEQAYGDKVNLVFRQFPLNIHPQAPKAGEASLCANAQGKFWEMHDALFADQKKLAVPALKETAKGIGLDVEKFDKCLDSGMYAAQVAKDMEVGKRAGVSGTPASFINGILVSGAQPFSEFKKYIDAELEKATGSKAAKAPAAKSSGR